MLGKAVLALLLAAALALSPLPTSAQTLPGDHVIVPGVRIGAALLEQADQGALVRDLGEPDQTVQRGDFEYYVYGVAQPDAASPKGAPPDEPPDELTIEFDLAKDAPFEISTTSAFYRTREGLGVGSAAAEVRAALGAPLCAGGMATGAGLLVYGAIWFSTSHETVTRVSIRKALSPADFQAGPVHC